jgi:hypothetical protein
MSPSRMLCLLEMNTCFILFVPKIMDSYATTGVIVCNFRDDRILHPLFVKGTEVTSGFSFLLKYAPAFLLYLLFWTGAELSYSLDSGRWNLLKYHKIISSGEFIRELLLRWWIQDPVSIFYKRWKDEIMDPNRLSNLHEDIETTVGHSRKKFLSFRNKKRVSSINERIYSPAAKEFLF